MAVAAVVVVVRVGLIVMMEDLGVEEEEVGRVGKNGPDLCGFFLPVPPCRRSVLCTEMIYLFFFLSCLFDISIAGKKGEGGACYTLYHIDGQMVTEFNFDT